MYVCMYVYVWYMSIYVCIMYSSMFIVCCMYFVQMLLGQADPKNYSVVKTRRCFHWQNHFFQLDIYKEPQIGL